MEFISHTVRSYSTISGTKLLRASESLSVTGSSVLSGITFTKAAGIVVLAFAKSQVKNFIIFYYAWVVPIIKLHRSPTNLDIPNILLPYVFEHYFDWGCSWTHLVTGRSFNDW